MAVVGPISGEFHPLLTESTLDKRGHSWAVMQLARIAERCITHLASGGDGVAAVAKMRTPWEVSSCYSAGWAEL